MFKYILQHILLDVLYFPLWWYTRGFLRILRWAYNSLADVERQLALGIWLKAMFKPMFQDYTWEGRLVSFFMRVVLLIFKIIMFGAWVVAAVIVIGLWLLLPITALWLIATSYDLLP